MTVRLHTPVTISSGTFSNRSNATLYVPKGSKEAYAAADYWKEFKEIVEINMDFEGTCGDGVTYFYSTSDNTLIISKTGEGTGMMTDYYNTSNIPWYSYRNKIQKVEIESGVTSIGDCAFQGCKVLISIIIPNSVTSIGSAAFRNVYLDRQNYHE